MNFLQLLIRRSSFGALPFQFPFPIASMSAPQRRPFSPSDSSRPLSWILLVFVASLGLAGCDSTPGLAPDAPKAAELGVRPADSPSGLDDIARPGPIPVPQTNSGTDPAFTPADDKSTAAAAPSPTYGCYVSVYRADASRNAGFYYAYHYLVLDFPAAVADAAEGHLGTLRWTRTGDVLHPSRIQKLVVCRIPQTRQAAELVMERLDLSGTIGAPAAPGARALSPTERSGSVAAKDDSQPLPRILDGDIPNEGGYTCVEGTDWTSFDQNYCTDGDSLYLPNLPVDEDNPDDGGGNDGGGDDGGHGGPGGGSGGELPDPWPIGDEDPSPAPVDTPVSKAEVADLIRHQCEDIQGETLPEDDDDLWSRFQSSVRRSINLASDPFFGANFYQYGSPPEYLQRRDLDGYAVSISPSGQFVLTGTLEVKFSENLDGAINSAQSEDHIDDLGAAYNFFPDHESSGAPLYTIVTLHQGESVDWLGRYERTQNLKARADRKGVNLSHLRVVSSNGAIFLEGGIINTPKETDGHNNTQVRFYVDCTKET